MKIVLKIAGSMCRSRRAEQISLPPPIFYIFPAISRQPNHSPPHHHFPSFSGTITRVLGQNASIYGKWPSSISASRYYYYYYFYVFQYTAKIETHSIKMLYMNSIKLCLVSSLKYTKIENKIIFARPENS